MRQRVRIRCIPLALPPAVPTGAVVALVLAHTPCPGVPLVRRRPRDTACCLEARK
jgi:hypothetical protein